jgi:hypothetical protein
MVEIWHLLCEFNNCFTEPNIFHLRIKISLWWKIEQNLFVLLQEKELK